MKIKKKKSKIRFKYRVAGLAMHEGHVLIHQYENSDYWSLPGGNVEFGETTEEALKRELFEEADLQANIERLLWVHENYFVRKSGKQIHELCFFYLVDLNHEEIVNFTGKEGKRKLCFKWVPLDEIAAYPLFPGFLKSKLHSLPAQPEHVVTFAARPTEAETES